MSDCCHLGPDKSTDIGSDLLAVCGRALCLVVADLPLMLVICLDACRNS